MELEKHYQTGVLWQDYQHKTLLDLLKKLNTQAPDESEAKALAYAASFLAMYVHAHFSLEEEYMKEFNYPDIDIHVQDHKKFIILVKDFRQNVSTGSKKAMKNMLHAIRDWIENHILGNDKKLGQFIHSQEKKRFERELKKKNVPLA